VSSADGWLVESESPKQAPGLCREKRRPKAGEGRAYTQNPATAQARAPGLPLGPAPRERARARARARSRSLSFPPPPFSGHHRDLNPAPRELRCWLALAPSPLQWGLPRSSPRAQVRGGAGSRGAIFGHGHGHGHVYGFGPLSPSTSA